MVKGGKIMKFDIIKLADKLVEKTLKLNVNSTTSLMAYQPEMPAELNNIRKYRSNNDK